MIAPEAAFAVALIVTSVPPYTLIALAPELSVSVTLIVPAALFSLATPSPIVIAFLAVLSLTTILLPPSISLEEKNVTMNKEIELFGQSIFSSNHIDALKIEENDRRFTVINTGENLVNTDFLHYGSYENLVAGIKQDLEEFAKYLKNYDVDINLANTPLDTPEKRVIIKSSQDNIIDFHNAIVKLDIDYFYDLIDLNYGDLHNELQRDFRDSKINRANIAKAYNALFSKNLSSKEILKRLRAIEPYDTFPKITHSHSGEKHYFNLAK